MDAHNWWVQKALDGDADEQKRLAQFVLETDSKIEEIVGLADDMLAQHPSAEDNPQVTVGAVVEALRLRNPGYTLDRWTALPDHQCIALARAVLGTGSRGTCLDWSLVVAACLLRKNLSPIVVVSGPLPGDDELHALVGYRLAPTSRDEPLIDKADMLGLPLLDVNCLYESAALPTLPDSKGLVFRLRTNAVNAESLGRTWAGSIRFAVDVAAARRRGICQLTAPPARHDFVGQQDFLVDLQGEIQRLETRCIVIYGPPGAGKKMAAAEAIRRLTAGGDPRFARHVVVSAPPVTKLTLEAFCGAIVKQLGDGAGSNDKERSLELLRETGALLVLLDFICNRDVEVAAMLQELPHNCRVLITTIERPDLASFPCTPMPLTRMHRQDVLSLIDAEAKRLRIEVAPETRDLIEKSTAGLPYLIRIAVGLLSDLPVGVVHDVLRQDTEVRVFDPPMLMWLEGLDQEAQEVLRAASVWPWPASYLMLQVVSGLTRPGIFAAIRQSSSRGLLRKTGDEAYRIEVPLLGVFVSRNLRDAPEQRQIVEARILEYYRNEFSNSWTCERYAKFRGEMEQGSFPELLRWCREKKQWEKLGDILKSCVPCLHDLGYWRQVCEWCNDAYDPVSELNSHCAAELAFWLALVKCKLGEFDTARYWASRALAGGKGDLLNGLIALGQKGDERRDAVRHFDAAQAAYVSGATPEERELLRKTAEQLAVECTLLYGLGDADPDAERSRLDRLLADIETRLKSSDNVHWFILRARVLASQARCHQVAGDMQSARKLFRHSEKAARRSNDLPTRGVCAAGQGLTGAAVAETGKERDAACTAARRGISILNRLGWAAYWEADLLREAGDMLKE